MADTQEQLLTTVTPTLADYIRLINSTPESVKATLQAVLDLFEANLEVPVTAYTTSDFSKTSSTTLANVTGLSATLVSGGKYKVEVMLFIVCNASGGVKTALSTSDTLTVTSLIGLAELDGAQYEATQFTALNEAEGETALDYGVKLTAFINVNAGGTLTVQFAQNASFGTASTVKAGSWLTVTRIG